MKETMVDTKVTYTLEHAGRLFIVENVPARVCKEAVNSISHLRRSSMFRTSSRAERNRTRCYRLPYISMHENTAQGA